MKRGNFRKKINKQIKKKERNKGGRKKMIKTTNMMMMKIRKRAEET